MESKKQFKHQTWCAAKGCPIANVCGHALADPKQSRELIRAPFRKRDGKFHACNEFAPCL